MCEIPYLRYLRWKAQEILGEKSTQGRSVHALTILSGAQGMQLWSRRISTKISFPNFFIALSGGAEAGTMFATCLVDFK